ncbi:MAG: PhoH family protein [Streptococcaceae bacterium]|jgi:phosphate starvation-inducible PhoH-like protein|nr:PhoH family protein [Streptococcaceae bacterium]
MKQEQKGYYLLEDGRAKLDFVVDNPEELLEVFGSHEKKLKLIEEEMATQIIHRGEMVQLIGTKAAITATKELLEALLILVRRGQKITTPDIVTAIEMIAGGELNQFIALYEQEIIRDNQGKPIRAKNLGQAKYIEEVAKSPITFGIGSAGTGKTFLAVVLAVAALRSGQVKRIILTRPAVEAGESLGFLPGDLKEKVDPYLRPVYDALFQIFGTEHTNRLMDRGVIEIAPLAYMRGRTLDDAFVILDEAQNTTVPQMKMFLTRLGFNSKMIINGDISQIDLGKNIKSGLVDASTKLKDIKEISFVTFSAQDVVRHPVVRKIINAYEKE